MRNFPGPAGIFSSSSGINETERFIFSYAITYTKD